MLLFLHILSLSLEKKLRLIDLLIVFIADDTDDIVVVGLLSGEEMPKKLSIDCFDKVKLIWMQRLKYIKIKILISLIIYELSKEIFLIKLLILNSCKQK